MSRRVSWVFLAILSASLGVLLVLNRPRSPVEIPPPAHSLGAAPPASSLTAASAAASPSSAAAPIPDLPRSELSLFFEDEDALLHRELRLVPVPPGPSGRIRAAVIALLEGPTSETAVANFPPNSTLLAVYLAPPGMVTVDLDVPPGPLAGYGSHAEWMALTSLAATVLESSPEGTKGIYVTLRGETPETFAGHIQLSDPLWIDRNLFAEELTTPGDPVDPAPSSAANQPEPRRTGVDSL